jgi:hypothetical protein
MAGRRVEWVWSWRRFMIGAVLAFLVLLQATTAVRPGVVAGRLQTREGAPAAAVRISALPAPPPNILPSDGQNYYATTPPASTTVTDAQGRYRLTNLAPGRYFILARTLGGYSTFYPAMTTADRATIVNVGSEAPVEGIDFTVILPPGGRVNGRVDPPPSGDVQEKAVLSGVDLGELLESPIGSDGSFSFGHLPTGSYLLSLFPEPPGMASRAFRVEQSDTRVDLTRPALRTVTGRVVVKNGPLPYGWLGFSTESSYVTAHISADGSFRTQLQPARHTVELAGIPGGYSLASVRLGSADASRDVTVGGTDLSGLVITVSTPPRLPRVRGKVVGVPAADLTSSKVELSGHVIGVLETPVQPDGSFEFAAVTPGTYRLRLPQVPAVTPTFVVVGWEDTSIQIGSTAAR